jgi:hypothetical protein
LRLGLSVDTCGGRVFLWSPGREGNRGQQAAVGPVAQSPCAVPGVHAGDHGPPGRVVWSAPRSCEGQQVGGSTAAGEGWLARSGTLCDAASWSVVCACLQAWQAKLRPRWTFRQPGPSCPLLLPPSLPPCAPPPPVQGRIPAVRLPHARPPRAAQRSFCHSWQGPFPRACPAPLRARDLHAASLHACHHAHVRCCGSSGAAH